MFEIARAFTSSAEPVKLVIPDEPTSSIDCTAAAQLLDHVRRFVTLGGSCVLISRLLNEILRGSDPVAVMRDGKVAVTGDTRDVDRGKRVSGMGGHRACSETQSSAPTRDETLVATRGDQLQARRAEVMGLTGRAGLADRLHQLCRCNHGGGRKIHVSLAQRVCIGPIATP